MKVIRGYIHCIEVYVKNWKNNCCENFTMVMVTKFYKILILISENENELLSISQNP